jgi:hypothetical protein
VLPVALREEVAHSAGSASDGAVHVRAATLAVEVSGQAYEVLAAEPLSEAGTRRCHSSSLNSCPGCQLSSIKSFESWPF